ncbi:M1 family metallopeptidase [Polluticaenibacter yanchengensis]|uniref:M1 family aminopeptidase n=1 Tax=Polluticaenibacter yanchengensis TaxID=3014562 RepID=A0ABT4UEC6_9BACT|nr:M1 family aminopeptidase [Chitinophagaceae bacterium LY-5]
MKLFSYIYLFLFLFIGNTGLAQTGKYWQQQVNYDIHATLNDKDHTLNGFVKIEYINNSPDTLRYLWLHVWPNAYKNDKTAFSEQMLLSGNSKFYFSDEDERGYLNRLDVRVNKTAANIEDHPVHSDIVRIVLPEPILPKSKAEIETPFFVQIPKAFSRMGHVDQHYVLTQWYPKIAVYDVNGWHEMPYLELGEYYNNFGNYKVSITLPENYVVAATGSLKNTEEKEWLKKQTKGNIVTQPKAVKKEILVKSKKIPDIPASSAQTKTLEYNAENVTDFAWMADKRFAVKYDTAVIGNKTIDVWNFYLPKDSAVWKNSMLFSKRALHFYSKEIGNYPFPQVSVVGDAFSQSSGMEYPMITNLNAADSMELDIVITHEIGHNWFQGVIANDERTYPWMDEGFNAYFENKYARIYYSAKELELMDLGKKLLHYSILSENKDLPVNTVSVNQDIYNFLNNTYSKPVTWLQLLNNKIGDSAFTRVIKTYYNTWQFKHPAPEDFKQLAESVTNKDLTAHFAILNDTLNLQHQTISDNADYRYMLGVNEKRPVKAAAFLKLKDTDKYRYINIAPAIGFNNYDKFQVGLLLHNNTVPASKFSYILAPMFATGTKQLNGIGRLSYNWLPQSASKFQKIEASLVLSKFTFTASGTLKNEAGEKMYNHFTKIAPGLSFYWKKKNAIATIEKSLHFKTYIISEQQLEYYQPDGTDEYFVRRGSTHTNIIPQVNYVINNERTVNPWKVNAQLQYVGDLVKAQVEGNYFLNYNSKGQGLSARLFAGKIMYTTSRNDASRARNSRYHFFIYGPNINQDYTYSNAFMDRNANTNIMGRQILERDAAFKYRTDYGGGNPGIDFKNREFYFDNWMASTNFLLDVPNKLNPLAILPVKIPLRVFADIATSHIPWKAGSEESKFLYSFGLNVTLFKCINLYYPLVDSKEFKDPIKNNAAGLPPNWVQKRLTFSINTDKLQSIFKLIK